MWKRKGPYGSVFWSNVLNNFHEEEWHSHFVMEHFQLYIEAHQETSEVQDNKLMTAEPQLRLAVALWWYATL